jgi:type I restriction enzyme M protein
VRVAGDRQPARRGVLHQGAGAKPDLLSFTKGRKTARIWYCDLSWVKAGNKTTDDGALRLRARWLGARRCALPASLLADWQADEADTSTPFPSYALQLALRETPQADSTGMNLPMKQGSDSDKALAA